MKFSEKAVQLAKDYNPFHAEPFLGPAKLWGIGYGHIRTVRAGLILTETQADSLLREDLLIAARCVTRLIRVPLNQNQFDALVSFVFCIGNSQFETSEEVLLLNRGWYSAIPALLAKWNKANKITNPTLTRHRAAEGRLWNQPIEDQVEFAEQISA